MTLLQALAYILSEPRDALVYYRGRLACHLFRRHNVTCEGRIDDSCPDRARPRRRRS